MDDSKSPDKSDTDKTSATRRFFHWILSPFVSTTDQEVSKYGKYLGFKTEKKDGLLNVDFTNLLIGGTWGAVSGYTSEVVFAPVPDKYKLLRWVGYLSKISFLKPLTARNWIYPTFVAIRIARRTILSALLFDQTERRMAQTFGLSNKTFSSVTGFTVLSFFFSRSTDIRDTAIASSVALGGYLAGSQFAKLFDQNKISNHSEDNDSDRKK